MIGVVVGLHYGRQGARLMCTPHPGLGFILEGLAGSGVVRHDKETARQKDRQTGGADGPRDRPSDCRRSAAGAGTSLHNTPLKWESKSKPSPRETVRNASACVTISPAALYSHRHGCSEPFSSDFFHRKDFPQKRTDVRGALRR